MDRTESIIKARQARIRKKNQVQYTALCMFLEGYSLNEISHTVHRCIRQVQRYYTSSRLADAESKRNRILELRHKGLSIQEIQSEIGCCNMTVYRALTHEKKSLGLLM